jgi:hypothetical protein
MRDHQSVEPAQLLGCAVHHQGWYGGIFEVAGHQHDPSILGAEFVGESLRIVRFSTVADTLVVGVPVGQCKIPAVFGEQRRYRPRCRGAGRLR